MSNETTATTATTTTTTTTTTTVQMVIKNSPGAAKSVSTRSERKSTGHVVRERTVSETQSEILGALATEGFNWKQLNPSAPNLIFPIQSMNGQDKRDKKFLFAIHIPYKSKTDSENEEIDPSNSCINLQIKEEVKTSIQIKDCIKIAREKGKPWILRLQHTEKSGEECTDLFEFVSVLHADDIWFFITNHIPDKFSSFTGFRYGQICMHHGEVEKQTKTMFGKVTRYLRLVNSRLLVYRDSESTTPVNIVALSRELAVGLPDKNYVVDIIESSDSVFSIEIRSAQLGPRKYVYKVTNEKERAIWVKALNMAKGGKFSQQLYRLAGKKKLTLLPDTEKENTTETTEIFLRQNSVETHSLLHKIKCNQQFLFKYIKDNLTDQERICRTGLWTKNDWLAKTPQKMGSKRGKTISAIDAELEDYHFYVDAGNIMLQNCRLVCYDTDNSGNSQIGICLPGRKTEVFNVGKTAIVSPLQLFKHDDTLLPLPFDNDDWKGALGNTCVGKELMQASPNLTELYEKGEIDKAKELLRLSTIEMYHNICLASYVRSRSLHVNEGQVRRSDGVLSWVNVAQVLGKSKEKDNDDIIDSWSNIAYIYNPTTERIKSMLKKTLKQRSSLKQPPKLKAVASSEGSKHGHKKSKTIDEEQSRVQLRTLVVSTYFFALLRCLLESRYESLTKMLTLVDAWVEKHSRDRNDRTQTVFELHKELGEEKQALENLFRVIPTIDCINSFLQLNPEEQDTEELKSDKDNEGDN